MDIEQTEDKDNDIKFEVQIKKYIYELTEHLHLNDVNLLYENFVESESRNSHNSIETICSNLYDETWNNFQHLKKIYSIEVILFS